MANVSFTGIGSKVLSIAKKAAPIGGAAHAWLADPMADGRGLEGSIDFMIDRLKRWKFASPFKTTQLALDQGDAKYPIRAGALAAITGLILEEIGKAVDQGAITSLGTVSLRYGTSALVNSILSAWVWLAHANPHGEGQSFTRGAQAGGPEILYRTAGTSEIRDAFGVTRGGPRG